MLICLPIAENGKRYPARRCLVPSLRQPLNPLRFPSNPYFRPPKCLYFRVVSGLHLMDVLLGAHARQFQALGSVPSKVSWIVIYGFHFWFPKPVAASNSHF